MLEELKNRRMPEEMIARRVAHLTEILTLTEEQQEQITGFLTEASTKLMTAREESQSREEFREAAVAIFQELDQQISSVLTAEQLELYNELKEERRDRRGGPFGRDPRN